MNAARLQVGAAPPAPLPWPLGAALEPLYRAGLARRNRAFDAAKGVVRLPVPVLSVGNISVGGTGKTPMVMAIVAWLLEAGKRPIIAMRGYKARRGGPSDEQQEYADMFPRVPIVAQPDRLAGIRSLLEQGAGDVVVLDDGFQHRRLARDLNVVLVDATRDPFEDRCLPAGWLREPVESLRRADAVVLTHAEEATGRGLRRLWARVAPLVAPGPVLACRHEWAGLLVGDERLAVEPLEGARVVLACGIGNPGPFASMAVRRGAVIVARHIMADHHHWTEADSLELARSARSWGAGLVLTTAKDWSKLARVWPPVGMSPGDVRVARPVLQLALDGDEDRLRGLVLARAGVAGGA